ncbi:MAG: DUF2254 domain-containing protein [Blastochloris sp.]|nr:DUF2254 domain-containing protein [Blastochloris sp.]
MKASQFITIVGNLRTSFWFVPGLMLLGSVALAFGMIQLDQFARDNFVSQVGWVYTGGPEGARAMLSGIASSVITVAGVVFSITIAALAQAASQYGPRLLRNFMRDLANQFVLGTFIATFMYCLLVLRTVRGLEESVFVPYISVTVGVMLAVLSLGVLIFFIDHLSNTLQAEHLIGVVGNDLDAAINNLFPDRNDTDKLEQRSHEARAAELPALDQQEAQPIASTLSGYIQLIDSEALVEIATAHDLVLRVQIQPGQFIVQGSPLVHVWAKTCVNDEHKAVKQLRASFTIGKQRTQPQHVQFAIQQLVEIAVRALSPSVNDPLPQLCASIGWAAHSAACRDACPRRPTITMMQTGYG